MKLFAAIVLAVRTQHRDQNKHSRKRMWDNRDIPYDRAVPQLGLESARVVLSIGATAGQ